MNANVCMHTGVGVIMVTFSTSSRRTTAGHSHTQRGGVWRRPAGYCVVFLHVIWIWHGFLLIHSTKCQWYLKELAHREASKLSQLRGHLCEYKSVDPTCAYTGSFGVWICVSERVPMDTFQWKGVNCIYSLGFSDPCLQIVRFSKVALLGFFFYLTSAQWI
jgi:hypothetical protein